MQYWVVGGEYASTSFDELTENGREESYGPFERYRDAVKEWRERSWATVDNCNARYRIISEGSDLHWNGLGPRKWA